MKMWVHIELNFAVSLKFFILTASVLNMFQKKLRILLGIKTLKKIFLKYKKVIQ